MGFGSQLQAEVFDDRGFNRNRGFFSQLPFEHIDPLTGNLLLVHTDLALPGNAGFDLRIQRTYNSKIYQDYNLGQRGPAEDSWAGWGWSLHMGRVFNVLGTDTARPIVEMPDGSRHPMFDDLVGDDYISRDYWIFDKNASPFPTLKLPNGVVYTFGRTATIGATSVAYATQIADPFGNKIIINYESTPYDAISSIVQELSPTARRTITFTTVGGSLQTMTYGSSTWRYIHRNTIHNQVTVLEEVDPPVGQSWRYVYNLTTNPIGELVRITTPHGGQIDYTYKEFSSLLGTATPIRFHGVEKRNVSGRDLVSGEWTYTYAQANGGNQDQTTIEGPCNTVTMRFLGVGRNSNTGANANVRAWQVGLLMERTVKEGITVLQTEQIDWRPHPLPFGDRISNDDQTIGNHTDTEIYVPLVWKRIVTRHGRTYTTTNSYHSTNFNDYGRPWQIVEDGDLPQRTTEREFDYDFGALYIKDKIESEKVTVSGETFTKSFEYDNGTGFLTDETIYGIPKNYTKHGSGNVESIKDAGTAEPQANITRFPSYAWGQAERIDTPAPYTITRVINSDGTIDSETRRGFTTSFEYDDLFRPTRTTPPAPANPTITTYDNSGDMESVTVSRGTSWTRTDLDGFGRPSGTENSVGIKSDIDYDACGRRVYESYPYEDPATNNIGSTFEYDGLDRVTKRKNPSHLELGVTEVTYTYADDSVHAGLRVNIKNERNKTTEQTWRAFGDPSDSRLTRVGDANGKNWLYSYNAVGSLTGVSGPGGVQREWRYFTASERPSGYGLLKDEKHPENDGRRITYAYYPNGLVMTRTDALSIPTIYEYDRNNRLTKANRPGTVNDTDIGYDHSDNRTSLVNGYVSSTFGYDGANRLTSRTDVIGGRQFITGYVPDGNDNVSRIDYHSGLSITYDYDSANRITAVGRTGSSCSVAGPNCFARLAIYHPSGGLASFVAGNGGLHTVDYDPKRYWVTQVRAGGHLALDYKNYDGVGNVGDIDDSRPGFNQHFVYDDLDRLTTANGVWGGGTFGYDDYGNRTSRVIGGSSTTYVYSPTTQWLETSVGGGEDDSFDYDFSGNLTSQNGRGYTYTPENMLETADVGGLVTTYRYDGDTLRKIKEASGSRRFFIHGLGNQLLSEWEEPCATAAPRRVKDNIYLGSRLLAWVEPAVPPVTVSLSSAGTTVLENAATSPWGVKLVTGDGAAPGCPVTVTLSSTAGTAVAGQDFDPAPRVVTFPGSSGSGTVLPAPLGLINDALDEDDETFTLKLGSLQAVVGSPDQATVTVQDDDPMPSVITDNQTIVEGNSGEQIMTFPTRLSAVSGRTVRVAASTRNVTATAGQDYQGYSETLAYPPGTVGPYAVPVRVLGDILDEGTSEAFEMVVTPLQNAEAGGVWTGTIQDDDEAKLSVSDCATVEAAVGCAFSVTLSTPTVQAVGVDYATAAAPTTPATAGTDYTSASGRVTFPAGTTALSQTVMVTVLPDTAAEDNEAFRMLLSSASGAPIDSGEGYGAIIDDEQAKYYTVPPCRVLDTRVTGPALGSGQERSFAMTGQCSVPAGATAVALNVTVVQETHAGNLRLFAKGLQLPQTSVINYAAGLPRANNATVLLGARGQLTVRNDMSSPTGTTQVIVDVYGYYR